MVVQKQTARKPRKIDGRAVQERINDIKEVQRMKTRYNFISSKEPPAEEPPKQKKQKQNASASPTRASRAERAALRSQQADNVSKKKNLKKPGLANRILEGNKRKGSNEQEGERIPLAPDGVGSGPDNAKTNNIQEAGEIRSAPDGVGSGPDKAKSSNVQEEDRITSAPDGVGSGPDDPLANNADTNVRSVLEDKDITRHL